MKVVSKYHTTRYDHDGATFDHWVNRSNGTHGVVPVRRCRFEDTEAVPEDMPIYLIGYGFTVDTDSALGGGCSVVTPAEDQPDTVPGWLRGV